LSDLLSSTNERPSVQSAYVNEIGEELYELVGIDPADLEDLLAKANEEFAGTGMPWS
jgi:hypothetical protein